MLDPHGCTQPTYAPRASRPASAATTCASLNRAAAIQALWIWREASTWQIDRGTPVWDPALFDERFVDAALARGKIIGASFGSGVAGVALLQWCDELWWPDRPAHGAAYVHKVAVARAFAGRAVVDALLAECERQARARDITTIRLNTLANRSALRSLYERLGFTAIDVRHVESFVGVRYEKKLVN